MMLHCLCKWFILFTTLVVLLLTSSCAGGERKHKCIQDVIVDKHSVTVTTLDYKDARIAKRSLMPFNESVTERKANVCYMINNYVVLRFCLLDLLVIFEIH